MLTRTQTADVLKRNCYSLMIQSAYCGVIFITKFYNNTSGHMLLFLGGPPVAPIFMTVLVILFCFK